MTKDLVVVGGPNGSGKSTFAEKYASVRNFQFLGADKIAYELDPADPYSRRIEAGTLFVRRLDDALEGHDSLIVESTLAGKSLRRKIAHARNREFIVTVFFLFLDSAELCVERVVERVQKGGHNVPEADIRRRFSRSLVNFWDVYRTLADHWYLVQNSGANSFDVALGTTNTISVRDTSHFRRFQKILDDHRNG